MKTKKEFDIPGGRRYNSVVEMMEGEKWPKPLINRIKKLIEKDEKNLTTVEEDGIVFLVDKKTKEKV
jgi:hypothetical protein